MTVNLNPKTTDVGSLSGGGGGGGGTSLPIGRTSAALSGSVAQATEDRQALDDFSAKFPPKNLTVVNWLTAASSIVTSPVFADTGRTPTVSVSATGTGTWSITTDLYARVDPTGPWLLFGSSTLTNLSTAPDWVPLFVQYKEYQARVSAVTGTAAATVSAAS